MEKEHRNPDVRSNGHGRVLFDRETETLEHDGADQCQEWAYEEAVVAFIEVRDE